MAKKNESEPDRIEVPRPVEIEWHASIWKALSRDRNRVPHALLLHGQEGLGKAHFASRLANWLLCEQPGGQGACGYCVSCHLYSIGNHPDILPIAPIENSLVIKIDQMRELIDTMHLKPHSAAFKVGLILGADTMNSNAANSLLKILEEPSPGTILILTSNKPNRLPITVRSRCAKVSFSPPAQEQARRWLQTRTQAGTEIDLALNLSSGAPLAALTLLESNFLKQREGLLADLEALGQKKSGISASATRWRGIGAETCLNWLQGACADMAKMRLLAQDASEMLHNPDLAQRLHALKNRLDLKKLFDFADLLAESSRLISSQLDEQLLLEDILLRWQQIFPLKTTN